MKTLLLIGTILAALATLIAGWFLSPQAFGASPLVFTSAQEGASPSNGYYLQTDGVHSTWAAVVGGGGGGGGGTWSTSTSQTSGTLLNYPNNVTDVVLIGGTATTTGATEWWFDPAKRQWMVETSSTTFNGGTFNIIGFATTTTLGITSLSNGLLWADTNGSVLKQATSSITFSGGPFSSSGTLGALVGGTAYTRTYWGLATTSNLTAGQLLMSNGGAGVSSLATTTLSGSGLISVTNSPVVIGATPSVISLNISTTTAQNTYSTTTATIYIDSRRTDTYTADGSIFRPYTTITAANTAVAASTLSNAVYEIAPGSTYSEQSMTLPNIPLEIRGNGASIIMLNGANLGYGTITIPADFLWNNAVIFGAVISSASSITNPHTFVNSLIVGSTTFSGLATLINSSLQDQNKETFAFLTQSASSTFTMQAGGIGGIANSEIDTLISNKGTLNLNAVQVHVNSGGYAVDSSTSGSILHVSGVHLINDGIGGCINTNNAATAANPNAIQSFDCVLGAGTANSITAGSGTTLIANYNSFTTAGVRVPATGTDKQYPENEGLYVDGISFLNMFNGGLTALGTTSPNPRASLFIASSTDSQLSLSDNGAATNRWNFRAINNNFYLATSSPTTYATSTASALFIDTNGALTIAGLVNCDTVDTDSAGKLKCGVDATTGGGGVGTVSTSSLETAGQLPYWTTSSGFPAKLGSVATSSITFSGGPFSSSGTLGALVGGTAFTRTYWGLSTTTAITQGQILYASSASGVTGAASSTIFGVGTLGQVWGYTGAGGGWVSTSTSAGGGTGTGSVATSTNEVSGQVPVFSSNSATPATIRGYTTFLFDGTHLGVATTSQLEALTVGGNININKDATYKIGNRTVLAATSTTNNLLVGILAGSSLVATSSTSITSAQNNTVLGNGALQNATSTINETAIGYQALNADTFSMNSVWSSGYPGNTANTGVGAYSLNTLANGSFNTALGYTSGYTIASGTANVSIGSRTLDNIVDGSYNTAVGDSALGGNNASLYGNTAVGWNALDFVSSGSYNIGIGYDTAGLNLSSGSYNIGIGTAIDFPSGTGNSQLNIGNILFGNGVYSSLAYSASPTATGRLGIGTSTALYVPLTIASSTGAQLMLSDGNKASSPFNWRAINSTLYLASSSPSGFATTTVPLLSVDQSGKPGLSIGSTTPIATLSISPAGGNFSYQLAIGSSTGSSFLITNAGAVFAPNTTSSGSSQTGYWCYDANGQLIRDTVVCVVSALKFKKDVQTLDEVGLSDLLALRPVSYHYKDTSFGKNLQIGFIADEIASSSPFLDETLVAYDSEGAVHGFNYETFTALITKSIQDFYKEFQVLVARVSGLEERLNTQQTEIEDLQHQINELRYNLH